MKFTSIYNLFLIKVKKKRNIISVFHKRSATNLDLAIKLDIFERNDFLYINELIRNKIIVKVGYDNLFYLDEKKLIERRLNNIKWMMIALIILIVLLYKIYLGG